MEISLRLKLHHLLMLLVHGSLLILVIPTLILSILKIMIFISLPILKRVYNISCIAKRSLMLVWAVSLPVFVLTARYMSLMSGGLININVLVACEESQVVCSAFRARGLLSGGDFIKKKIRPLVLILSAVYLFCKICTFAERHFSIDQNFVVGLFLLGVLVYALFKLGRSIFGGGVNGRDKEGR